MSQINRIQYLAVCILALSTTLVRTMNSSEVMRNFPAPFSHNNRILGLLLSYNLDHIDPLFLITNEYVSMCESGWNVSFVLFTTENWTDKLKNYLRSKTYCYQTDNHLDIRYSLHDKSVRNNLGSFHRAYIKKELDNFDFYVYHEDDIIFKHSHLSAYLSELKAVYQISPEIIDTAVIGFQRFRRLVRHGPMGDAQWTSLDMIETDLLEETPAFVPMCVDGTEPYLHVKGNTHQGMWALTRGQILMLEERCNFTDYSNPSREHMSSFSIYSSGSHCCGMNKILPGEHFSSFLIQHYYQQRHVSWNPTYSADYELHQNAKEISCWNDIKTENLKEISNSPPYHNYTVLSIPGQ